MALAAQKPVLVVIGRGWGEALSNALLSEELSAEFDHVLVKNNSAMSKSDVALVVEEALRSNNVGLLMASSRGCSFAFNSSWRGPLLLFSAQLPSTLSPQKRPCLFVHGTQDKCCKLNTVRAGLTRGCSLVERPQDGHGLESISASQLIMYIKSALSPPRKRARSNPQNSSKKKRSLDMGAVYRHTLRATEKYCEEAVKSPIFVHELDDVVIDKTLALTTTCTVAVSSEDSLDAAFRLRATLNCQPLVLNFANPRTPGGAVASGVLAQEEALFRRSNYHQHLTQARAQYPLGERQAVVCCDVWVVKDGDMRPCPPWKVNFVACAALKRPNLAGGRYTSADAHVMSCKIRAIFQSAVRTEQRVLVLGAFGCGGYRNPPEEVARLFHEALFDEGYAQLFDHVEFAVPGHLPGKAAALNLQAFRARFPCADEHT